MSAVPKVSVCIPTYNTARYLPAAIESVLAQTFQDYELVVCDNASTDQTPELCRRYDDPRLRYVRYEELVNQGGNWNRCVSLARGEYIALLHADDQYLPRFLEHRLEVLDRNPEVGLAFGAVSLIDSEGGETGQQIFRGEECVTKAGDFYPELLLGCVISPVSPVVRRKCYEAVGRFNEDRLWGIDWEMWLRLAARYGVAYSPAIDASYRIHGSSGSSTGLLAAKNGREDLAVLTEALRSIDERPELRRFSHLKRPARRKLGLRTLYAAGYNCELGNLSAVRQNLEAVVKTDWTLALRPTVWILFVSSLLGPGLYRRFRKVRPA